MAIPFRSVPINSPHCIIVYAGANFFLIVIDEIIFIIVVFLVDIGTASPISGEMFEIEVLETVVQAQLASLFFCLNLVQFFQEQNQLV